MASLPSHAIAALGIGAFFYKPDIPKRVWVIGAQCSVIPDLDVIGFQFGIRYGAHRGFTHSLVFAALLAGAVVLLGFRGTLPNIKDPCGPPHGLVEAVLRHVNHVGRVERTFQQ